MYTSIDKWQPPHINDHFNRQQMQTVFHITRKPVLKDCTETSRKQKESCFHVFPSSTKREFRHFHVVVVQRQQRNVQKKRDARAKLFFFAVLVAVAVAPYRERR